MEIALGDFVWSWVAVHRDAIHRTSRGLLAAGPWTRMHARYEYLMLDSCINYTYLDPVPDNMRILWHYLYTTGRTPEGNRRDFRGNGRGIMRF